MLKAGREGVQEQPSQTIWLNLQDTTRNLKVTKLKAREIYSIYQFKNEVTDWVEAILETLHLQLGLKVVKIKLLPDWIQYQFDPLAGAL